MKLKKDFEIYHIDTDYMLIPVGEQMASFGGTVILNDVSAFLLEQMKQEDKTRDELLNALLAEYAVDRAVAERDLDATIAKFKELKVVE